MEENKIYVDGERIKADRCTMKISEVIKKLQEIKKERGDLCHLIQGKP